METAAELIIEVLEDEECGYRARALGEGIFTHGATLKELRANVREAVDAYYDGEPRPKIVRLHFVRPQKLEPGDHKVDIFIQGKPAMRGFDISRDVANGGVPAIKTFSGVQITDSLFVEVRPTGRSAEPGGLRGPLLCGAELLMDEK